MYKRFLPISLLFISLFACNPGENEQLNLSDNPVEIKDIATLVPIITGLEVDLEVTTTINISIQESSEINDISILVNQSEILNTKEKSFSFELNPYNYPNGENTLSVIIKDSRGNQSEKKQIFKVNKLLVSIAAPTVSSNSQLFFSVNTIDGDLLAFAPVSRPLEIVKLYADDDFTPQPIIVTSYEMQPESVHKAILKSFANLEPGTDLVKFQEAAGLKTENTTRTQPTINPFNITVNNIDNEKIANSLFAVSNNHLALAESIREDSNEFEVQLPYTTHDTEITKTLIYTSGSISGSRNNEFITLEEYKYLLLDNPKDSTISYSSFNSAKSTSSFGIPADANSYSQRLMGYLDDSSYQNNEFFYFFESKADNQTNEIVVPVLEELHLVRNQVRLQLANRNVFEAHTIGVKDMAIPNWSVVRQQNSVIISGAYDKLETRLLTKNDPDIALIWTVTDRATDSFTLLFDTFEFPEEFITYANVHNLNLVNLTANSSIYTQQLSSTKTFTYEELLFYPFLPLQPDDVYILETNLTTD